MRDVGERAVGFGVDARGNGGAFDGGPSELYRGEVVSGEV